jgi:hypothetical protein
MDVDPGLTRTHTHSTNYEYETKQKIDDGVLFVLDQHAYCDYIVLAHWDNNNSPQVDMSFYWNNNNSPQVDVSSHWGTLSWFRANQLVLKKIFVNLVLNFINW